ncbi:MAG: cytidylate kinase-like family protein [Eubacteriales bacterium]|nr:cytidylate kinase-like family protein [Eubacteriales bacterium]
MSENNVIITIARQFGAGGNRVGRIISKELGIPLYDKELIIRASKESGYSEELFHQLDEQNTHSFLYSLAMGSYLMGHHISGSVELPLNERLFIIQAEVVKKIASEGPCVFVGRCADYILRDDFNITSVFLHADIKDRMDYVSKAYELKTEKAKDRINKVDRQRSGYYNYFAHDQWLDMLHYDLTINTSSVGIEKSAEFIKDFALAKANK